MRAAGRPAHHYSFRSSTVPNRAQPRPHTLRSREIIFIWLWLAEQHRELLRDATVVSDPGHDAV